MFSEETFAKRLDAIHAQQDEIKAARPGDYFETQEWKRLDFEAQAISARAGW